MNLGRSFKLIQGRKFEFLLLFWFHPKTYQVKDADLKNAYNLCKPKIISKAAYCLALLVQNLLNWLAEFYRTSRYKIHLSNHLTKMRDITTRGLWYMKPIKSIIGPT